MTPRRRLRCALTVVGGGIAAAALVGCSNGVHVAGPTKPHESVISGAASPSAAASSAKPKSSPKSTSSPSAGKTGSPSGGNTDDSDDQGTGSTGNGNSGTKHNGQGTKSGKHHKNGSKSGKSGDQDSGDQGIGTPSSTSKPKSKGTGNSGQDGTDSTSKKGRTCELDDLTVSARVPAGSGAAGSQYVLITFTNKAGEPCWMYGYAGVSFVGNQDGTQLGKPARRAKSVSASPVKLSDGDTETELLKISDAGVWDAKKCVPTTSDGFRIYPPSSYTAAYVKFATTACQSKSVRQLTVFPVGTKS